MKTARSYVQESEVVRKTVLSATAREVIKESAKTALEVI